MRRDGKDLEYAAKVLSFLISEMDLPNGINYVKVPKLDIVNCVGAPMRVIHNATKKLEDLNFITVDRNVYPHIYALKNFND